jgi:hypothetical protein
MEEAQLTHRSQITHHKEVKIMHHTERRRATVRIGEELRHRGWELFGYYEDKSDPMTDYYSPASWRGVATHSHHAGVVVCVDVGDYTVENRAGKDGWPEFQATPHRKTWHVECDGKIVRSGVGLSPCAGYGNNWEKAVKELVDEIEYAAKAPNRSTDPSTRLRTGAATVDTGDYTVTVEHDRDWTWLIFDAKPPTEVREQLKDMGARWGRKRQGWYFRRNVPDEELAWLLSETDDTPKGGSAVPLILNDQGMEADPTGYEPGKGNAYDYIPDWMNVPDLGETENQDDPPAVIKLFTPDSDFTWYVIEYDEETKKGYGLVARSDSTLTELGYFSLEEIREVKGPMGLRIERDKWFRPTPVSQLPEYQVKWGNGGPFGGSRKDETEPQTEPGPDEQPSELPEGWTADDIQFLLEKLEDSPILIADSRLGISTILSFKDVRHCGFGLMKVEGDGYTLRFDAGGAMQRTPSGKSWTRLRIEGEYDYPLAETRATLKGYLSNQMTDHAISLLCGTNDETETIVLTSFDNGKQFGYDNPDRFGIWGPYKDADGKRWTHGWTVWDNTVSSGPVPVRDPSHDESDGSFRNLGSWSLSEAIRLAEEHFGAKIRLEGEQWEDEYPRYAELLQRRQDAEEPETPPWAMTQRAYQEWKAVRAAGVPILDAADVREHERLVREAVERGEDVPAHVLADYPDLVDSDQDEIITDVQVEVESDENDIITDVHVGVEREPETGTMPPQGWQPSPETKAEFGRWKLELLTGLVKKRRSAFYRALKQVTRPTLWLALQNAEGTLHENRRRELIERRLAELAA